MYGETIFHQMYHQMSAILAVLVILLLVNAIMAALQVVMLIIQFARMKHDSPSTPPQALPYSQTDWAAYNSSHPTPPPVSAR